MISKGWNCFAVNCQKNLIQLYDRVTIFFLFVTVNVISPLPHCSSRLAPFCFMKNNTTHACIVSALSSASHIDFCISCAFSSILLRYAAEFSKFFHVCRDLKKVAEHCNKLLKELSR